MDSAPADTFRQPFSARKYTGNLAESISGAIKTMAVQPVANLTEDKNFGKWLEKINEIINALRTGSALDKQLADYLAAALQGNQISQYLADPSQPLVVPDATQESGKRTLTNVFSYNWNDYARNGVFLIPYVNDTKNKNAPLGMKTDGILWCASGSKTGPVVQIGAMLNASTGVPVLALRMGLKGTSAVSWKPWMEWPNKKYVDDNFLNKVIEDAQTVNSAHVTFAGNVSVGRNLSVEGESGLKGRTVLGGLQGDTSGTGIVASQTGNAFKVETASLPASGAVVTKTKNHPIWNSATGEYVPKSKRTSYIEPIKINKDEAVADISGTAQYANFIVPEHMVSKFKPWEIASTEMWKPVTAKALSDLYSWTEDTMMPKSGGIFDGIVRHRRDIFLDYMNGYPENRTAAIRSVVRPLQLQCQGSTHLVSNTKQSCLYLEKEDADSAEFTTLYHDASFQFRAVELNIEKCHQADSSFDVQNVPEEEQDPENKHWVCYMSSGVLTVWQSGKWKFQANQEKLDALGVGERLEVRVYYDIENHTEGASRTLVSAACEHLISYGPGDDPYQEGVLDINDRHYQIVFTDTDWEGIPIVRLSTLAPGCRLADGSQIAAGSVINGIRREQNETVYGTEAAYGTVNAQGRKTDALLTQTSIIRAGSLIIVGSRINGNEFTNTSTIRSDILVSVDSTLKPGCVLRSGSRLGPNSVLNGYQYTQTDYVEGQEITAESKLAVGSKILLGSLLSTASEVNGIPGRSGFLEVRFGSDSENLRAELAVGTVLAIGTFIGATSSVNGTDYKAPYRLSAPVTIEEVSYLASGSQIAAGSMIEADSVINGMKWLSKTKASGADSIFEVSESDIAPVMYVRTYDNIHQKWDESGWKRQCWSDIYPEAKEYDGTVWKNWLFSQIDMLVLPAADSEAIKADLLKSLQNEPRNFDSYALIKSDASLNVLTACGRYRVSKDAVAAPNYVYEMRCYISAHTLDLQVERISVQPYRIVRNAAGERLEPVPLHSPVDIFRKDSSQSPPDPSLHPDFYAEVFRYFDFSVTEPGIALNKYVVTYSTQLVPEQKNVQADMVSELLVFRVYSDTIDPSGPIASFEKIVSQDVSTMFGAPFIFGARTRTGITSTGELGDPLYDLGCLEISEDVLSLKLRKRNVTMNSEIKDTLALNFERRTENAGSYGSGIAFYPSISRKVDIGTADMRFNNVYFASTPVTSSDKRLKTEIADFPEELLDKWANVNWVSFKFKDAVKEKGQMARVHSGVVAQDVQTALKGIKLGRWSFFCRDKWSGRTEADWTAVPAHVDEYGNEIPERLERSEKVLSKAGDQYSIRYQEMQCIENAYLRREIGKLRKELESLQKLVASAILNTRTD